MLVVMGTTLAALVIFIACATYFPDTTFKVVDALKWAFIALAVYGFYQSPELLEYALH